MAQIGQALKDAGTAAPNSLVAKIKSDDRIAVGYLTARYGRSVCVESEEELRGTRSGLLRDGVSVAGYNYRNRSEPDERLVFGMEVRRRQAIHVAAAMEQVRREITTNTTSEDNLKTSGIALRRTKQADLELMNVASFHEAGQEIRTATAELENLDVSSIADLEQQAAAETAQITAIAEEKDKLQRSVGLVEGQIEAAAKLIQEQNEQIAKLTPDAERAETNWRVALSCVPEIKRLPFESLYRQEIESGRPVKSFHDRNVERRSWTQDAKNAAENVLRDYNRDALEYQKVAIHSLQYPSPIPSPELMTEWFRSQFEQVADQIRRQRDTGLVEQREKLVLAERAIHQVVHIELLPAHPAEGDWSGQNDRCHQQEPGGYQFLWRQDRHDAVFTRGVQPISRPVSGRTRTYRRRLSRAVLDDRLRAGRESYARRAPNAPSVE